MYRTPRPSGGSKTQPRRRFRVNWSNWFARNLSFAWTGSSPEIELVNGWTGAPYVGSTRPISRQGIAYSTANGASDTGLVFTGKVAIKHSTEWAFAVLSAIPGGTANASVPFAQRSETGNTPTIILTSGRYGYLNTDSRDWDLYCRDNSGNSKYIDQSYAHTSQPDGAMRLYGGASAAGTIGLYRDGVSVGSATAGSTSDVFYNANSSMFIGGWVGGYAYPAPTAGALAWSGRSLTADEWQELNRDFWQVFIADTRTVQVQLGASGGGITTSSATGRFRARSSNTSTSIRTVSVAGRDRARGSNATTPIKALFVVGREHARGSNASTTISIVSAAGRTRALGSTSASQVAPSIVVASAVGRERVRGSNMSTSIRTVAGAGRHRVSGADTTSTIRVSQSIGRRVARGAGSETSVRTTAAAARTKTRGSTSATQIAPGVHVASSVGKLRSRGGCAVVSIRVTSAIGRGNRRGTSATTSIRLGLAAGRIRVRGIAVGAPFIPGVTVASAVGRLIARSIATGSSVRATVAIGRARSRGRDSASRFVPGATSDSHERLFVVAKQPRVFVIPKQPRSFVVAKSH